MKRIVLSLVALLFSSLVFSAQPVRKPFVELFVNGKKIVDGAVIDVKKGDRFTIIAQIKGGIRDIVRFPDTYAEMGLDGKIVSRGYNKLVYSTAGKEYSWEQGDENVNFESDNQIKLDINSDLTNKHQADVLIPVAKVEKSYIQVTIKTIWKFSDGTNTKEETNEASAIVHLNILGNNNEWFAMPNVKADGTKDTDVEQTLSAIQGSYTKIEKLFSNFDFASIQPEIKNLQNSVNQLDQQLKTISTENPTHYSDIFFIGLPSDRAISEIANFRAIATAWNNLEQLVNDEQAKLDQLEQSGDKIGKRDLLNIIKPFLKWQEDLPGNAENLLHDYAKEINWQNVRINSYLPFNPDEERINNLSQVQQDLHRFLDNRKESIGMEKQKISYALTRLQAVRIFDGMLMGFFSSINFAHWENTRQ